MSNEHSSPLLHEQGTFALDVTSANYLPDWLCGMPGQYQSRRIDTPFPGSYVSFTVGLSKKP